MLPHPPTAGRWPMQVLVLGYSGLLSSVAGFVNAVALLVLAFPVGNLTGITTQLGIDTANPWRYEGTCSRRFCSASWPAPPQRARSSRAPGPHRTAPCRGPAHRSRAAAARRDRR